MYAAEFATAPPQKTPFWSCQLPPPAGAVNVLMPNAFDPACVAPAAKSRRVPFGIVTSARPPFPSQPVATVDVPIVLPLGAMRVSEIEVPDTPRFEIAWRTPSFVRASPSSTPGWVGPLIRSQAVRASERDVVALAVSGTSAMAAIRTARTDE